MILKRASMLLMLLGNWEALNSVAFCIPSNLKTFEKEQGGRG